MVGIDGHIDIPMNIYPNSKQMIIDYFGNEAIEKLFSNQQQLLSEYNLYRNAPNKQAINVAKSYHYEIFLSRIGACLKFDMDDTLQQIINKYWTKECENEFKKHLIKFGFFSEELFKRRVPHIIGNEKYAELNDELTRHASEFRIKWCGFEWPIIKEYHIFWNFLQSLKFQWKMKPQIIVKKCLYCGKEFIPIFDLRFIGVKIAENNSHMVTINDIDFCGYSSGEHALGKFEVRGKGECKIMLSKEKMSELLKRFVDITGTIPRSQFKKDQRYLKILDKKRYNEAVQLLCQMPPYTKSFYTPYGYKEIFGSWGESLQAAGISVKSRKKTSTNI